MKGLLAVGREIIVDQLDGRVRRSSVRAVAHRAGAGRNLVRGYLRTLGRIAPLMFPLLADGRGSEIARGLLDRADAWRLQLRGLDPLSEADERFFLARELRLVRFLQRGTMPPVDELAELTGVDADTVAALLPGVRNEETLHELEVEC
jgi:hypothetical protein